MTVQAADFGFEISGIPQGHRRVVRARRKHPIVEKPSEVSKGEVVSSLSVMYLQSALQQRITYLTQLTLSLWAFLMVHICFSVIGSNSTIVFFSQAATRIDLFW